MRRRLDTKIGSAMRPQFRLNRDEYIGGKCQKHTESMLLGEIDSLSGDNAGIEMQEERDNISL